MGDFALFYYPRLCDNVRESRFTPMKKVSFSLLCLPFLTLSLASCGNQHIVKVTGVSLNKDTLTLSVGGTETLLATIAPDNATNQALSWSSNNTYASVSASGLVTGVSEGTSVITVTAKDGGFSDTCTVTISNKKAYGTDFYNDYYDDINTWNDASDLKSKLYTIIRTGYHSLPYTSPNWESNQYADQAQDDFEKVDVVYSNVDDMKKNTNYSGSGWQREHAFAASLMTGQSTGKATSVDSGRATDYHNLFASYNSGNTSRGNKNFGVADTTSASYVAPGAGTGTLGDYSFDDKNFEPSNADKGRLARAIFYMGVMYSTEETVTISGTEYTYQPLTIQEDYVNYDSSSCAYAIGNLSTLISWNDLAVNRQEYQHNESVYSHIYSGTNAAQGNRNPFVDYPELVDYIYGSKKNEAGSLTYLKPSCVALETTSTVVNNYAIKSAKREYSTGDTFSSSDYELVAVKKDFSTGTIDFTDATLDYTFASSDAEAGGKSMSIVTPINTINFDVTVSNPYSYYHIFSGSKGGLGSVSNGGSITLSKTTWSFAWTNTNAVIVKLDDKFGVQFGTSSVPVNSLTVSTQSAVANVTGFYVALSCASGKTIDFSMSDGSSSWGGSYKRESGTDAPYTVWGSWATPVTGILSITISGTGAAAGAVYLHSLAYNVSE